MIAPMNTQPSAFLDSRDFARIARAIRFIEEHFREQPRLARIAQSARLSEFHFNRLFRRWAGITPRQYLAFITAGAARAELAGPASVLDAAYTVGLSGAGRLHDLMVTLEAFTPGEIKTQGEGTEVRYGFTATPFGTALIARTARGLCHLSFVEPGSEAAARGELADAWPRARLIRDDAEAEALAARIWSAGSPGEGKGGAPLRLAVPGTNFQLRVWQALLALGPGSRTSYAALADAAGVPGGARAAGGAVGANPVAWLIPCHNVLRKDGQLGGYHWGEDRKRAMLAWETIRQRQSEQWAPGVPRRAVSGA
jgi:AraC family transcriptional regulator, regulatory protein of adaptative response / methylated-DNA-[protein]-cysteine methyltransferase